jgi:hypothetical protein
MTRLLLSRPVCLIGPAPTRVHSAAMRATAMRAALLLLVLGAALLPCAQALRSSSDGGRVRDNDDDAGKRRGMRERDAVDDGMQQ